MCTNFRLITIDEAQAEAELYPDSDGYIYYWRTERGELRRTGFVVICACRKHQYWGSTKMDVCLSVLRLYPYSNSISGVGKHTARALGKLRVQEKRHGLDIR